MDVYRKQFGPSVNCAGVGKGVKSELERVGPQDVGRNNQQAHDEIFFSFMHVKKLKAPPFPRVHFHSVPQSKAQLMDIINLNYVSQA